MNSGASKPAKLSLGLVLGSYSVHYEYRESPGW
jgi:hypothetical protein